MNTTHDPGSAPASDHDAMLTRLENVDPADAPDVAEELARRLSDDLDGAAGGDPR